MSNLLAGLTTSGNALDVFQQALSVIQNNVNNASTPGYAKQQMNLQALPFDVASGLAGGVAAGGLDSSRNAYADEEVQRQTQALGRYAAQVQGTGTIQNFFDVSGATGVAAALNSLFQSFSAWSATPGDATARQTVLSSADNVAASIRSLANSLSSASGGMDSQISTSVDQINSIASQIQQYNVQRLRETRADPGTDAQLHSALESLSELTGFTTVTQNDGTVTVLVGGSTPLVIGDQLYSLRATIGVDTQPAPVNPQSPPTAHVLDSQGNDITAQMTDGQLGGLLDVRNRVLGSILGDAQQGGSLNQFARGLADAVNQILQSGTVSPDPAAAMGVALFTYDSSDATAAAASLALNPAITPDQLAPVDSQGTANGNANLLASLGSQTSSQGRINGLNLMQYFASIESTAGRENQTAAQNEQAQQHVLAQARTIRDQASAVSLDEEAVSVLQFQKAYQAAAQVLTVLSALLDTTINLIRQ